MYIFVHICVCMYLCVYVYVCICICVCVCVGITRERINTYAQSRQLEALFILRWLNFSIYRKIILSFPTVAGAWHMHVCPFFSFIIVSISLLFLHFLLWLFFSPFFLLLLVTFWFAFLLFNALHPCFLILFSGSLFLPFSFTLYLSLYLSLHTTSHLPTGH